MNALHALQTRTSVPKLCDPIPSDEELGNIFKSALRAADHSVLRPWRFLLIKAESRQKLGDLFVKASLKANPEFSLEKQEKIRNKPLRAPLIVVSISCYEPHAKVPEIEQDLSAGAATQNMLVAAYAQNIGAIWRTGPMAYDATVKQGLGLKANEKIIGFVYMGTINGAIKNIPPTSLDDYVQDW
ncbi:MAG: nitroreductase [SAR86 cluster bacterium]|uniref:Putative NAD(P)H nitroreductase n=1 Tax=SAR86 cluster bacterium TaxID=2030880 RepID=A0A2A4MHN6_9GAMM|nr:MAG: nitroreductase [SAR86 cluster bacterium]